MISSKVKALIIVSVLLLFTGFFAVGCKGKAQDGWVNTNSMPGQTFKSHRKAEKKRNPRIVYLGANDSASTSFGPSDVRFDIERAR
jgi:hypothetical protein